MQKMALSIRSIIKLLSFHPTAAADQRQCHTQYICLMSEFLFNEAMLMGFLNVNFFVLITQLCQF